MGRRRCLPCASESSVLCGRREHSPTLQPPIIRTDLSFAGQRAFRPARSGAAFRAAALRSPAARQQRAAGGCSAPRPLHRVLEEGTRLWVAAWSAAGWVLAHGAHATLQQHPCLTCSARDACCRCGACSCRPGNGPGVDGPAVHGAGALRPGRIAWRQHPAGCRRAEARRRLAVHCLWALVHHAGCLLATEVS